MEVILTRAIKRLGNTGEIVNVRRGYCVNYLVPRGWAILSNKENKLIWEKKKQDLEQKLHLEKEKNRILCKKLADQTIKILVNTSSTDGKIFGSVTAKKIVKEIESQLGLKITVENVEYKTPIKFSGLYEIELSFFEEKCRIYLVVAEDNLGAEALISKDKNDKEKQNTHSNTNQKKTNPIL